MKLTTTTLKVRTNGPGLTNITADVVRTLNDPKQSSIAGRAKQSLMPAGPNGKNVHFVQTYSFFGNQRPVGQKVLKALMAKYPDIKSAGDVTPAVGVANAYDAMMLTALAIKNAGSTDGPKIREGFYKISSYDGLIKSYRQPFTATNHDAINENDYVWTQFIDNQILPPLEAGSEFDLASDPRYAGIPIPVTESLKDTIARVLPYYESAIAPCLKAGETATITFTLSEAATDFVASSSFPVARLMR